MLHFVPKSSKRGWRAIATIASCSLTLYGATPEGWELNGSKPGSYEAAVDLQTVFNGRPSAYLKYISPNEPASADFGTLMQYFSAKQYNGQRVRFSAFVKADAVENWAGLWMRVDRGSGLRKIVSFDNMQNRPIKGTTGWQFYEVVLDVPEYAALISFGILIHGQGKVWLNNVSFEIVSKAVSLTAPSLKPPRDGPINLGFDP